MLCEERMKCEVLSRHPVLAFLVEQIGVKVSSWPSQDAQLTNCMLASRTTDSWMNPGERVYFMPIRPGGARQAKLDPKWQDGAFICTRDRSDEMLVMTPSGVYKTRTCSETPRVGALGLRVPHDVEGYSRGTRIQEAGEMAADALPADMAVPMPAPASSLSGRGGGGTGGLCSEQVVHQEIR